MKQHGRISYPVIVCILCFCGMVNTLDMHGQEGSATQLWFDFHPTVYVNSRLQYYGDLSYRNQLGNNWNRISIRPSLRYHIRKWQLQGGVGFFYAFDPYGFNRFEIRPWQGFFLAWPQVSKAIGFKHLLRFEERFSYITEDWRKSFDFRMRYKLSANFQPSPHTKMHKWFFPAYVEFFFPLYDDVDEFFSNRLRFSAGLGYKYNRSWKFELLYILQRSKNNVGEAFNVSDHSLQFKFIKTWYKKEK